MSTPSPLPPSENSPTMPPPLPPTPVDSAPVASPQPVEPQQQPAPQYPAGYTPPPIREPFSVPWWALLALVPFAVVRWVASGPAADEQGMTAEMAMGFRLGSVMGGVVFACAVAWVAFMTFGRRRSVATGTMIGVYALSTLAGLGSVMPGSARSPNAAVARPPVAVQGTTSRGEEPSPVASTNAMPREAFERATAALRAAQAETTEPARRWGESGAFDLSGIKVVEDLDRRIDLLEALEKATREARHTAEGLLQQLRGELSAADAGPVQQELWVAQWATDVNLDDDRQVSLATEEFLAAGRVQLRMLRQEWGKWRLNPATERVEFDDTALQDRFARQARAVEDAEADLKQAVRKAKQNPTN